MTKRLAIIGAGSSGLIFLKSATDDLPDWDIVCFEKSDNVRGCWGNPPIGFVSTSTKYTTQFACFAKYDAHVNPDGGLSRSEFFRDGEYGDYLESFADEFDLRKKIRLRCQVLKLSRAATDMPWEITWHAQDAPEETLTETFDVVVLATGLAAEAKPIDSQIPTAYPSDIRCDQETECLHGKRIVVFGGGESAVDAAKRLADPRLGNRVFMSLRSGIRVSPRYHPIRGVPSDFLRNRFMLSIHPDLRNWIGQHFVAARIRHQKVFEKLFPSASSKDSSVENEFAVIKRDWAMRLTEEAKDNLFDMFHNKSDDFLDAVASGAIVPVGIPTDESFRSYMPLGQSSTNEPASIEVNPDLLVPAIGYRSVIRELTRGQIVEHDFHLGCCHVDHHDLFLIGFARPIIGNIPTISEMQSRYVSGLIAEKWNRPADIDAQHRIDQVALRRRFSKLDLSVVYPVEMFPYCDELARRMGVYPTVRNTGGLWRWCRMQLSPATTLHYEHECKTANGGISDEPIYLPPLLTILLLLLKPIDTAYRILKRLRSNA